MAARDSLERYRQKRNFALTNEPSGIEEAKRSEKGDVNHLAYVIQKHWASSLHYDFRLEFNGTLKSWAIPKGPSLDPKVKRMAVQVEDHPLSYGSFEGTIPAKQYGAGKVIVWDQGSWLPLEDADKGFREGKLKFEIFGEKLRGKWMLVRIKGSAEKSAPWLLIKERDTEVRLATEYDVTKALPDSVSSRSVSETPMFKKKSATMVVPSAHHAETHADCKMPDAAFRSKLPLMLEPQLATLAESVPDGGDWQYELKFDGYRLVTRIDRNGVRCFTRNGHDWTIKLPQLAKSLESMGFKSCWLDGEIIVPDVNGVPDFQLLQRAFEHRGRTGIASPPTSNANSNANTILYYIFDLPFYAGHDLRDVPLRERRALLQHLLKSNLAENVKFSESFDAAPKDLIKSACKIGFEGLIGKRGDSPYQSRRSQDWIKVKCGKRQEFLICGFTEPRGSRNGLGALLLGYHDANGRIEYAGNVGSGIDEQTLDNLRAQLDKLTAPDSPFDIQTKIAGKPHWVKPKLLAEVSFASWTNDNRLRHAVFRGLRNDKSPRAITREAVVKISDLKNAPTKGVASSARSTSSIDSATPSASAVSALPSSLQITHGGRVVDVQSGMTKLELVHFYATVASLMIPHLMARPVSLVRAPAGVTGELFFQKHANKNELPSVNLLDPKLDPGHEPLLEIHSAMGLLWAAQMNTVEFHTWNSVATKIDKPDRMTFDLDPGSKVEWAQIQQAATLVRTILEELGLKCFLKTSGGKGMHVVVPLKKQHDWDTVKDFSHHIVDHLAKTLPQIFVSKSGPKNRVGKVFVDYLRNGFGATTACAWTARARPGLGVSVPVHWDELPSLTSSSQWTVKTIGDRLDIGNKPWATYEKSSNSLIAAMKSIGFNSRSRR